MQLHYGRIGRLVRDIAAREITDTRAPLVSATLGILAAELDSIDDGEAPALDLIANTLQRLVDGDIGEMFQEVAEVLRDIREE